MNANTFCSSLFVVAPTNNPECNERRMPATELTPLSVLSVGYTRGLWEGESAEDFQRMMSYAAQLATYVVVANSYKRHALQARRFASNAAAIPTNAFCPLDSFLRMLWIGYSVLRNHRINLIQAQDLTFTGLAAIILGKWFKLPVNLCVYGPNVYDSHWLASHWSHRLLAPLARWSLRQCAGIQVDGQLTARRLISAGCAPDRVAVKPMVPANLDRFFEIPIARKSHSRTRLLFVGRLHAQKNLPLLFEVLKILQAGNQHALELTIVGSGPEERTLRTMVKRQGLCELITFRGNISRDEIPRVFADADIFVLTSDYEGYPRVLMEAAAAGLPIVATHVSGADEAVVNGRTGWIVPVGDAQAMAEKLSPLLAQSELRAQMGLTARQHIRETLDPRSNTPAQIRIWQKVADRNGTTHPENRTRRLLLFNLVTDVKHPILGFTTQWIRELAARVESIDVITMLAGEIAVPDNVRVHSVGKELGYSEPRRAVEFYRLLFRILREEPRVDGCFSHMMPIFSALAGPVLRPAGIPLVTWYAHPSVTPTLKLAHFASNRMVTSLPNAYPYRKDKLAVIGQGIDTALFQPAKYPAAVDHVILCVGRLSRVKNHPVLIRAMALLPHRFRLVILGATSGAGDEAYVAELRQLISNFGLQESVSFEKPVPPAELPAHYHRCALHVNLTPAGFGDKVAWEAMACGRPCLVANEDFRETIGRYDRDLLFHENDAPELAGKMRALLVEKSAAERDEIGLYLRAQAERLHSLPRLADQILEQIAQCRARHGSRR
jgi:glycosyltransferase involved in cell wall biosynthesis